MRHLGVQSARLGNPGFRLFSDTVTDFGKTYNGSAEKCTFTFRTGPEQLDFTQISNWLKNYMVSRAVSAVKSQGGQVLQVTLYRDKGPMFWTDWRGEITIAPSVSLSQGSVASFLASMNWVDILGFIFTGFLWFVIKPVVKAITSIVWNAGEAAGVGLDLLVWLSEHWQVVAVFVVVLILAPKLKGKEA